MAARGRLWPWLLVFALVAAQALGLMHRVVHGPQVAIGHEQVADDTHAHAHADAHADAGCDHGQGWLSQLFTGHDDDSTCRLFDPLNHEAMPALPVVALPLALSSFFIELLRGDFVARRAALFDARGPPALR